MSKMHLKYLFQAIKLFYAKYRSKYFLQLKPLLIALIFLIYIIQYKRLGSMRRKEYYKMQSYDNQQSYYKPSVVRCIVLTLLIIWFGTIYVTIQFYKKFIQEQRQCIHIASSKSNIPSQYGDIGKKKKFSLDDKVYMYREFPYEIPHILQELKIIDIEIFQTTKFNSQLDYPNLKYVFVVLRLENGMHIKIESIKYKLISSWIRYQIDNYEKIRSEKRLIFENAQKTVQLGQLKQYLLNKYKYSHNSLGYQQGFILSMDILNFLKCQKSIKIVQNQLSLQIRTLQMLKDNNVLQSIYKAYQIDILYKQKLMNDKYKQMPISRNKQSIESNKIGDISSFEIDNDIPYTYRKYPFQVPLPLKSNKILQIQIFQTKTLQKLQQNMAIQLNHLFIVLKLQNNTLLKIDSINQKDMNAWIQYSVLSQRQFMSSIQNNGQIKTIGFQKINRQTQLHILEANLADRWKHSQISLGYEQGFIVSIDALNFLQCSSLAKIVDIQLKKQLKRLKNLKQYSIIQNIQKVKNSKQTNKRPAADKIVRPTFKLFDF